MTAHKPISEMIAFDRRDSGSVSDISRKSSYASFVGRRTRVSDDVVLLSSVTSLPHLQNNTAASDAMTSSGVCSSYDPISVDFSRRSSSGSNATSCMTSLASCMTS